MKENKKINLLIFTLMLIIILLIVGIIVISGKKGTNGTTSLKAKEVANIKESSSSIPNFVVLVQGSYKGSITDEDLKEKGIKMYDFDVGLEYFWGVHTVHLTGVRFKDVLEAMQINNYKEIDFIGSSYRSVTYREDEITDDTFLVFYNDGKRFDSDTIVSLIAPKFKYKFSLEELANIYIVSDYEKGTETEKK